MWIMVNDLRINTNQIAGYGPSKITNFDLLFYLNASEAEEWLSYLVVRFNTVEAKNKCLKWLDNLLCDKSLRFKE